MYWARSVPLAWICLRLEPPLPPNYPPRHWRVDGIPSVMRTYSGRLQPQRQRGLPHLCTPCAAWPSVGCVQWWRRVVIRHVAGRYFGPTGGFKDRLHSVRSVSATPYRLRCSVKDHRGCCGRYLNDWHGRCGYILECIGPVPCEKPSFTAYH